MVVLTSVVAPQTIYLPNLRIRPSFASLHAVLESLAQQPSSWTGSPKNQDAVGLDLKVVNRYLLSIISSELTWFQDESEEAVALELRDKIWELASKRMAERCGRSAMPEMTRTWLVPTSITTSPLAFSVREPPFVSDNLGLKTWGTAFTMAKKLDDLGAKHFSHIINKKTSSMRALELGSGTGLVGIAAAATWGVPVLLTDLPEIQDNLSHNVLQNAQVVEANGGHVDSTILDWKDPSGLAGQDFEVVLAADSMYDDEHPGLVASMIQTFLKKDEVSRALVAVPLRDRKTADMTFVFKEIMIRMGFCLAGEGEEICRDDWGGSESEEEEVNVVVCWWGVWAWAC